MTGYRIESDTLGKIKVPKDALYGAQTQRAINNFPISFTTLPEIFIKSIIYIKQAAASANADLGCIDADEAKSIVNACRILLDDKKIMAHFPVDVFQTGSGTSTNMNVNEVISSIASKKSGLDIKANDHVNFGQSSNDVIPSAIHITSTILVKNRLIPALNHLLIAINEKAATLTRFCKTGRTHLMDAMPIRFDQVLSAWSYQIEANISRLKALQDELQSLPQGGTAIGTGINTHKDFPGIFNNHLNKITDQDFKPASNYFALIAAQDTSVALSGVLKTLAVSLMKISNDLRWMNSGPLSGLEEITLEPLQPGSSIMPGKVNPVVPESAAMVAAQVIGNDATITIAGQSGNFELNVMLPVIADNIIKSLTILSNSTYVLADKAIKTFEINEQKLQQGLSANPILVTALNSIIGYEQAAAIAKKAYKNNLPIIEVALEELDMEEAELQTLLDPIMLTEGGLS